jgi:hypothetical protein
VTLHHLFSEPEFWAALFGALAAFLLGALGTRWAASSARRTAGNLTLVALSQMYGLMENMRHYLFVQEANRIFGILKRAPRSFEIRGLIGLPAQILRVPINDLGFLADSNDPDLMSRLLMVERAVGAMLDLARRHHEWHADLQDRMSALDPTGRRPLLPEELLGAIGTKLFIQIDDAVEGLRVGLPKTRDDILGVGNQLRQALRMQFPLRRFVGFVPVPRTSTIGPPTGLPAPALWRRFTRWLADFLRKRKTLPWPRTPAPEATTAADALPPAITRFPTRTFDEAR